MLNQTRVKKFNNLDSSTVKNNFQQNLVQCRKINIFSLQTMKETSFIEQNKKKWLKFQQLASSDSSEPEQLTELYTDITDDLSYAQTFYNKRTVRVYLNQLAQSIHNLVHQERSESLKKLITAWRVSIPLEIYRARKNMLFALILAIFWIALGWVTTVNNPDFATTVLGSQYMEVTNQNISQHDPMGIYKGGSQVVSFIDITINNIKVSFYCFILGILFGIGTHIMMMKNAVMVGVFQSYFYVKGFLAVSFLAIWIHGAFEISSIVIACGAGITLGNGLLFPGSYTRLQSLQFAAKSGIKIMLSLIPFFIMAGWLEGYVTRNYSTLSEGSKWLLITFSFALIIFYFVIYPIMVARKHPHLVHQDNPQVRNFKDVFNLKKVRSFAELFTDSFSYYRVHIWRIFKANLIVSFPIIIAVMIFQNGKYGSDLVSQFMFDWQHLLEIVTGTHLRFESDYWAIFAWSIVVAQLFNTTVFGFTRQKGYTLKEMIIFNYKKLPATYVGTLLLSFVVFFVPYGFYFLLLFTLPLFILTSVSGALGESSFFSNLGSGFRFGARSYGTLLLVILLMTFIITLFAQTIAGIYSYEDNFWVREPIYPDLLDMLADFVGYVARNYTEHFMVPGNIVREVVYILFIFFTIPLFIIMLGFQFFTVREQETSFGLRMEFEKFGKRKKHQETKIDFE